jgi:hypothetical protein
MSFRILLILTLGVWLQLSPLWARTFYYCGVQIKNDFPIENGFVSSYLLQKMSDILTETGWKYDCTKGKPIKVVVKNLSLQGSSISANYFSGYTLSISFDIDLPKKTLSYSFSRYFSLPDPYLGTLKVRNALVDLLDTYSLKIKRDLLSYEEEIIQKSQKGKK